MLGHPNYEPMLERLHGMFDTYNKNGRVTMEYVTRMYLGQLN
jgi:hypothetical protein